AAALDYAKAGIRVNAVCPGVIRTPMVEPLVGTEAEAGLIAMEPIGRMGQPEEGAEAGGGLGSGAAAFVTCPWMPVDGGFVARGRHSSRQLTRSSWCRPTRRSRRRAASRARA